MWQIHGPKYQCLFVALKVVKSVFWERAYGLTKKFAIRNAGNIRIW